MRRKENKELLLVRWRRSVILYIKEKLEFIDVKIMAHVLSVVLMISVIAATVAWFRINVSAKIMGIYLSAGSTDSIELSVNEHEWEDILQKFDENENTHDYEASVSMVDISMPAFQNIYDKEGNRVTSSDSYIMAPGTYGSFSFYVKSVNSSMKHCELSIDKLLDTNVTTGDLSDEINRLFDGHILCFAKVEDEETYQYVSKDASVMISFGDFTDESEAKEVTIYWVWPYEYQDISRSFIAINKTVNYGTEDSPACMFALPENEENMPENLSASMGKSPETGYQLSMNQIFEWERYNATIADYRESDEVTKEKLLSDWYDYADTLVGSYVQNMIFHIEVEGVADYVQE